MNRKHRLSECNPRWRAKPGSNPELICYLVFDCPEGHPHCEHVIPFSPAIGGTPAHKGACHWERTGDNFENLSLWPSIRRRPVVSEDGTIVDACAMHIFIQSGAFQFCEDSK